MHVVPHTHTHTQHTHTTTHICTHTYTPYTPSYYTHTCTHTPQAHTHTCTHTRTHTHTQRHTPPHTHTHTHTTYTIIYIQNTERKCIVGRLCPYISCMIISSATGTRLAQPNVASEADESTPVVRRDKLRWQTAAVWAERYAYASSLPSHSLASRAILTHQRAANTAHPRRPLVTQSACARTSHA